MRREDLAILRFDPSSRAVFSNRPEGTYPTSADWSFVTGSKDFGGAARRTRDILQIPCKVLAPSAPPTLLSDRPSFSPARLRCWLRFSACLMVVPHVVSNRIKSFIGRDRSTCRVFAETNS